MVRFNSSTLTPAVALLPTEQASLAECAVLEMLINYTLVLILNRRRENWTHLVSMSPIAMRCESAGASGESRLCFVDKSTRSDGGKRNS